MTREQISYNIGLLFEWVDIRSREVLGKDLEHIDEEFTANPNLMYFLRFVLETAKEHSDNLDPVLRALEELTERYEKKN